MREPETRPAHLDWDFGDFPYGLEPLLMPVAGQPAAAASLPGLLPAADIARTLAALDLPPGGSGAAPADDTDTLYWFRWITGHQVTMLLWHLMTELAAGAAETGAADERTLAHLEACTDGYTAMLDYTGSCPPEIYRTLIRPRMYLHHRAFSGLWAADFVPLRRLLRGQRPPWMAGPSGNRLSAAVARSRTQHEVVAARLVPAGASLLQQSAATTAVRPTPRTAALFDSFFLTARALVGRDAVVAQLLHRVRAVALDLAANGCGGPTATGEIVASLRRVVAYAGSTR